MFFSPRKDAPRHLARSAAPTDRDRLPVPPAHAGPPARAESHKLAFAAAASMAALPILVVDNLPATSEEPVETVVTERAAASKATTTSDEPPSTAAPTTTAAPSTTEATTTSEAPSTTEATTTTNEPTATEAPTTAAPATTTAAPTTTAPPQQRTHSSSSVEDTIRRVFGGGALGDEAVEVARCESGLDPSARNPAGYYGLFQIGSEHADDFRRVTGREFSDAWDEAGPNTTYAKWLYDQSGWQPWGCAP